jgi:hypothetical protein
MIESCVTATKLFVWTVSRKKINLPLPDVLCRIVAEYCQDISVKIVSEPNFNLLAGGSAILRYSN